METLGLSMIIKDEPVDRLVMLIDFLRPLVSQYVIADTGSETYEDDRPLLEKAGATVLQIGWQDDFAWARNQTLEHINTDWVLHLDADEMPSYEMMKHLEGIMDTGSSLPLGYLYFTRNFWGGYWGSEEEAHWHCRLFKRGRGLWYKKLHEQVQLDAQPESQSRGTNLLVKAPKEARIIHSKPREKIEASLELYRSIK